MAKYMELNADSAGQLCCVAKALSSPTRIEILKLLYYYSLNINEISEKLGIPASSAGLHIKTLEAAGLINTELQPGTRGSMKICSRKCDYITIKLKGVPQDIHETRSISMPIGCYTDLSISPTCGIAGKNGMIGNEDSRRAFYLPERVEAQLAWTSSGYFEYKFPNPLPEGKKPKRMSLSAEICSEAPNFREDWKSDITLWINGVDCGTWTCPGDYGARRGRLNPGWWEDGSTQYGLLTTWAIDEEGSSVNNESSGTAVLDSLRLEEEHFITVRIGNKPDAEFVGGFNLFGSCFGDYAQDIILSVAFQ